VLLSSVRGNAIVERERSILPADVCQQEQTPEDGDEDQMSAV
jgi:hypothetical protein